MSVFDCHINRSPVAGQIEKIVYQPGKFFNADLDKASADNERNSLVIATAGARVAVVQIAGLVARRIVCFVREGQPVGAGERFGMIRFGSRLDVYLPEGVVAAGGGRADRDRRRNRARRLAPAGCRPRLPHRLAAAIVNEAANLARRGVARARPNAYIIRHGVSALRSDPAVVPPSPPLPADPGARAAAQFDHALGAVRGADRDPHGGREQYPARACRNRVRGPARRHRRPHRAHAQGNVALRRRARQPGRLRQFRRGAGADPVFLGPARAQVGGLDRGAGVGDLRRLCGSRAST